MFKISSLTIYLKSASSFHSCCNFKYIFISLAKYYITILREAKTLSQGYFSLQSFELSDRLSINFIRIFITVLLNLWFLIMKTVQRTPHGQSSVAWLIVEQILVVVWYSVHVSNYCRWWMTFSSLVSRILDGIETTLK